MKKSIKYLVVILLLSSCIFPPNQELINCKYQGGIIVERLFDSYPPRYHIMYKGSMRKYVQVYEIDTVYQLGDTINRECIRQTNKK